MPTFKNLKELQKYLQKQINDSLQTDVANEVINIERSHIQSDVYSAYIPKRYTRSYELVSEENFEVTPVENGVSVRNTTVHDDKYIPWIVETGQGYDYTGYGYAYEQPRPFVENTREDLKQNKQHVIALKKSLNKKGIKTT